MKISDSLLKKLPKVELHCHLDGCLRLETILDLARRDSLYPRIRDFIDDGDVHVSDGASSGVGSRDGEHGSREKFRRRSADGSVSCIERQATRQARTDGPRDDRT